MPIPHAPVSVTLYITHYKPLTQLTQIWVVLAEVFGLGLMGTNPELHEDCGPDPFRMGQVRSDSTTTAVGMVTPLDVADGCGFVVAFGQSAGVFVGFPDSPAPSDLFPCRVRLWRLE